MSSTSRLTDRNRLLHQAVHGQVPTSGRSIPVNVGQPPPSQQAKLTTPIQSQQRHLSSPTTTSLTTSTHGTNSTATNTTSSASRKSAPHSRPNHGSSVCANHDTISHIYTNHDNVSHDGDHSNHGHDTLLGSMDVVHHATDCHCLSTVHCVHLPMATPSHTVDTHQSVNPTIMSPTRREVAETATITPMSTLQETIDIAKQIKALQDRLTALTMNLSLQNNLAADKTIPTTTTATSEDTCTKPVKSSKPSNDKQQEDCIVDVIPPHLLTSSAPSPTVTQMAIPTTAPSTTAPLTIASSLPLSPKPNLLASQTTSAEAMSSTNTGIYIPLGKHIVFGSTTSEIYNADKPDDLSVKIELVQPPSTTDLWASYQTDHRGTLFLRTSVYRLGRWIPIQSVPVNDHIK